MSNIYFANHSLFTTSTAQNWTLDAGTTIIGNFARVLEVSWGGQLTSTTAMLTRWVRPSNSGTTTFSSIGIVQQGNPNAGVTNSRFGLFSTVPTVPTSPAALYATSWNAHGGIGRWLASPGEEWMLIGGTTTGKNQVVCLNDIGIGASYMSAGVAWEE